MCMLVLKLEVGSSNISGLLSIVLLVTAWSLTLAKCVFVKSPGEDPARSVSLPAHCKTHACQQSIVSWALGGLSVTPSVPMGAPGTSLTHGGRLRPFQVFAQVLTWPARVRLLSGIFMGLGSLEQGFHRVRGVKTRLHPGMVWKGPWCPSQPGQVIWSLRLSFPRDPSGPYLDTHPGVPWLPGPFSFWTTYCSFFSFLVCYIWFEATTYSARAYPWMVLGTYCRAGLKAQKWWATCTAVPPDPTPSSVYTMVLGCETAFHYGLISTKQQKSWAEP